MIRLQVAGIPAPQGSKSAFVRGGRAVIVEGSSAKGRAGHAAWRQAVATAARDWLEQHPQSPLSEPARVTLQFRFPLVASDRYRYWHVTSPDLDKLARSVGDALVSAGLLADDRFICELHAEKRYCAAGEVAGCVIEVCALGQAEAAHRVARKSAAVVARRAAAMASRGRQS